MKKSPITPLHDQAAWKALESRRLDIVAARDKAQARIRELEAVLQEGITEEAREDSLVDAALGFLKTGKVQRPSMIDDMREEHRALRRQVKALDRTLLTLGGEQQRLETELSKEVCRTRADSANEIGGALLQALLRIDELQAQGRMLRVEVEAAGYSSAPLPPVLDIPALGGMDQVSASAMWFAVTDLQRELRPT